MTAPIKSRIGDRLFYLHDAGWDDNRLGVVVESYPVTRITAQRVYFDSRPINGQTRQPFRPRRESFVSRQELEETGEAWSRTQHEQLHTEPPDIPISTRRRPERESVPELRRAMADAHPDRGGTTAAFQAPGLGTSKQKAPRGDHAHRGTARPSWTGRRLRPQVLEQGRASGTPHPPRRAPTS